MKKGLLILIGIKLYVLGIRIENKRSKLKKILIEGFSYNSIKIKKTLNKLEKLKYKFDVNESRYLKIKHKFK